MRAHLASRLRSSSLSAVPPPQTSSEYSNGLAKAAASILYRSPIPSQAGHPIYILNAAAFPDTGDVDFDKLLPYVLARLPGEEELITGTDYEVIFFAGGNPDGATSSKKNRPGWGWFIQAYHVLSRAMRKRLQKLYIVHERSWVRILVEMFSTIVSPKFRRKIVHVSSLTALGLYVPLEDLLIPPSAYLHDRRLSPDIHVPYASGRRAFTVKAPFPRNTTGGTRLPRILRETTTFLLLEPNVKTEGIFRVPPHARLREILREAYDRGQKYIIWKDYQSFLPLPVYPKAQDQDQVIEEVDQKDAYNVLLAAGLIKLWYSELRQPLFPDFTYRDLKTSYSDREQDISVESLTELISPESEWSKLPVTSRAILVRHLLPLLAIIVSQSDKNKMTAENLAVCFAPALVCGPDQLEDAKISSVIRRILTAAVELWPKGLAKACGIDPEAFTKELLLPSNPADWEDPLEVPRRPLQQQGDDYEPLADEKHFTGIIMQDNDAVDEAPPPLPPRGSSSGESGTKRKPAPPLTIPPRYSTIVQDGPIDIADSPATYATTTDGFAPPSLSSATETISRDEKVKFGDRAHPTDGKAVNRGTPDGRWALPGLAKASSTALVHRKPVESPSESVAPDESSPSQAPPIYEKGNLSPTDTSLPLKKTRQSNGASPAVNASSSKTEFRKPSWPASARKPTPDYSSSSPSSSRTPTAITSLARPVYPVSTNAQQQPRSQSNTPSPVMPKPRTASGNLLSRMSSFERRGGDDRSTLAPQSPGKLNLRKASVEDLRRLYEERFDTAETLVEAGSIKRKQVPPS